MALKLHRQADSVFIVKTSKVYMLNIPPAAQMVVKEGEAVIIISRLIN